MNLTPASTLAGPDDPRSWESWCEPWMGEPDGLRCVAIPASSLNLPILALVGRDVSQTSGGTCILRWPRERVAYEVHEILSAPERFSEEHAALMRRLVTEQEWREAEELVRQVRENTTPEERDIAAREAAEAAGRIRRALRERH